jgi:hypothetical protein
MIFCIVLACLPLQSNMLSNVKGSFYDHKRPVKDTSIVLNDSFFTRDANHILRCSTVGANPRVRPVGVNLAALNLQTLACCSSLGLKSAHSRFGC